MIDPKQIPDEVVEAAYVSFTTNLHDNWRDELRAAIAAAIAAALNAWPDRHLHEWQRPWLGGMSGTDIILPLPQELNSDQA
jgi:hypothetical protein